MSHCSGILIEFGFSFARSGEEDLIQLLLDPLIAHQMASCFGHLEPFDHPPNACFRFLRLGLCLSIMDGWSQVSMGYGRVFVGHEM